MAAGQINSSTLTSPADYLDNSFSSTILRLMPNGSAPLFAMTSMMKEETATSFEHGYFTKSMVFPEVTLTVALDATATTLTVADSTNIVPGAILMADNTAGEQIIVNTVPSATSITVTRGVGATAATAAIGVKFIQIGNAHEEGSNRPDAINIPPVRITNLTQIFRNSWALTGTAEALSVIAGDSPMAENRQDCAIQHSTAIEQSLIFGAKYTGTRNGKPFRRMDGFLSIVGNAAYYPTYSPTPNVFTAGSTTNWTQLEAYLEATLNQATDPKGGNERLLVCGKTALSALNNIGRLNSSYQITQEENTFGVRFLNFQTTRGKFKMIEHPLLNVNTAFSKMALIVDTSTFNVAYLTGRKTFHTEYNSKGQQVESGVDASGGTLTTELTCILKNPPANGVIKNLTAAAVG